jgi:hypothetical protein
MKPVTQVPLMDLKSQEGNLDVERIGRRLLKRCQNLESEARTLPGQKLLNKGCQRKPKIEKLQQVKTETSLTKYGVDFPKLGAL